MQIDLQAPLQIDSAWINDTQVSFEKFHFAWFIQVPDSIKKQNTLTLYYSGRPKESNSPPWDGGFIWEIDSLHRPWISVACQMVGGSVWFPCKDHYSEEPDKGVTLSITVPNALMAVGNGRLIETHSFEQKTTYTWQVRNPINNYGIAFYVGNYIKLQEVFKGEMGNLEMTYWVLDYNEEKAKSYLIPETAKTMTALEHWFGPYPFYEDGFQMVESSYIGMEHQSAIAYGNQFRKGRRGFNTLDDLNYLTDRLIVHEMAHEWFGNNITMGDLADRWVQEGFAALGEELMVEYYFGRDTATQFYLTRRKNKIKHKDPLIGTYGIWQDAGRDMYYKGWAIANMLRAIASDEEVFRSMLRQLNVRFRHKTIYSKDLERFLSGYLSEKLDSFFDQYLRKAQIPVLEYEMGPNWLKYRLIAEVVKIEMPVDIIQPIRTRLSCTSHWQQIDIDGIREGDSLVVDPFFLIEARRKKN
ncbi:MAG: M1 family metallopeptidase [Bacteroidota bacterium]